MCLGKEWILYEKFISKDLRRHYGFSKWNLWFRKQTYKNISVSFDKLNENIIDQLYLDTLKVKGDWMDFSYEYFNNNYYVNINLIFTHKNLVREDNVWLQCKKSLFLIPFLKQKSEK